ncbi:MAG: RtcB family protein [Bacillota bacterium]
MTSDYKGPLTQRDETTWVIPADPERGMRVPGVIYATREMIQDILRDQAPEQVANVACLPGIVKASLAMPDIHWGYGFPIGGVAAMSMDQGVIAPGGIGYDINCGVRLVCSSLNRAEIQPRLHRVLEEMFRSIPSGVGSKGAISLSKRDLEEVLLGGAPWAVKHGYGVDRDVEFCEERGQMREADPEHVSDKARKRGLDQLGTLGSGNHFIEVDVVAEIHERELADAFGLSPGMVVFQVHSGSRGLGHQVCTDHLKVMSRALVDYGVRVPDAQLACAPLGSPEGQAYYKAMACAANFAWANRQCLTHFLRQAVATALGSSPGGLGLHLVYDVAHNIARTEDHRLEGNPVILCVHRKGATRSFGPGHPSLPAAYQSSGQPVLVPGDMGRKSWVLAGTQESMGKTFGSTCHGSGRLLSRAAAKKAIKGASLRSRLKAEGILVRAGSDTALAEEAPEAYKDVDDVVGVVARANLSRLVAVLKPLAVMKG